jgi:branched-chain amino acid transport system permease protein
MASVPAVVQPHATSLLTGFLVLVTLASMWNLLAGYAGLVALGEQAFFGLGSYGVLLLALHGVDPFLALPAAAIGSAVLGVLVWWLLSRLRSGFFPIATLAIAADCYLIISRYPSLGGSFGTRLPGLPHSSAAELEAATYRVGLGVTSIALIVVYLVVRSRVGAALRAATDDDKAARSVRAAPGRARLLVFVIAAAGCAAAGALQILQSPNIQPSAAFSVQWSAEMIFAVLIGGIGTFEGPIAGAIVVFAAQRLLASHGNWPLIVLGLVAAAVAIWLPGGIWGLVPQRARLLPAGAPLWPSRQARPRGPVPEIAAGDPQPGT